MEGNAVVIDTGARGVSLFVKCFIKIIGFFIKRIYRMVCLKRTGTQIMSKKKRVGY